MDQSFCLFAKPELTQLSSTLQTSVNRFPKSAHPVGPSIIERWGSKHILTKTSLRCPAHGINGCDEMSAPGMVPDVLSTDMLLQCLWIMSHLLHAKHELLQSNSLFPHSCHQGYQWSWEMKMKTTYFKRQINKFDLTHKLGYMKHYSLRSICSQIMDTAAGLMSNVQLD